MQKAKAGSSVNTKRKKNAPKKVNRKTLIISGVCAIAIVAVVVIVIISNGSQDNSESYSGGGQIVRLLDDERFLASLSHGARKSGTYTRTIDGERIIVAFNINGRIEIGWIEDDILTLPIEWEDDCGHGRMLPRK